jgi:hypothetical protein
VLGKHFYDLDHEPDEKYDRETNEQDEYGKGEDCEHNFQQASKTPPEARDVTPCV